MLHPVRAVAMVALAVLLVLPARPAAAETSDARPFTVSGDAVRGATSRVDAPPVGEGVWTDLLGGVTGPRQTLYYAVHRQRADSTLHVSVVTPLGTEADQVAVTLLDAEGESCATDSASGYPGTDSTALIAAAVAIPKGLDASDLACAAAGDFVVQVDHGYHGSTSTGRRADVPVELRVREEPPVRDVGSLPATAATPDWRDPVASADPAAVAGGSSLRSARSLQPGTYRGSITTGDSQVFAVPVDFGQSLDVSARMSVPQALAARLGTGGSPTLSVQLLTPSRRDAAGDSDAASTAADHARGSGSVTTSSDGKVVYQYTDVVSYRTRYSTAFSGGAASERGRYLVVVSLLDRDGSGRRVTVPFRLGLAVRGTVAHVPDYLVSDATDIDGASSDGGLRTALGVVAVASGSVLALAAVVLLVVAARRRRAE